MSSLVQNQQTHEFSAQILSPNTSYTVIHTNISKVRLLAEGKTCFFAFKIEKSFEKHLEVRLLLHYIKN